MASHVELMPVHPFYRLYWQDGAQFDYSNDDAQLEAPIRAFSPADVDGYRRFLAYAENVYCDGYERLGHVGFLHFRDMIAAAPRLGRTRGRRRWEEGVRACGSWWEGS